MADVFVSYARNDALVAKRVAESLKAAGYDVWWDSELLPHHAFAQSIEKEVRAAKAVVVVWSEHAVASQWVRAEADLARSLDKLVQVSVDHCLPPLPFNQYQTADLRTWKGAASDPRWVKVLASVAQLTHRPATGPVSGKGATAASNKPAPISDGAASGGKTLAIAAGVLVICVALAFGGLWLAHRSLQGPVRGTRLAVQPYETIGGTPALHDFAAGLSDSLQDALNQDGLQMVSSSDAQTLKGADLPAKLKALDVGLLLSGTVQASGDTVSVRTHLDDPLHHATLWSADVAGSIQGLQPLQAQIGARTVAVLNCSAQALNRKSGIADADVLALFLHACDLSETSDHGTADQKSGFAMLGAMREAARKAPNFAPAHSMLAKHAAFLIGFAPGQDANLRQEAAREAHLALKLDPKDPDGYVTLGLLAPTLDFAQRERWFRQALAADPAWPHANGFLGDVMLDLGRIEEASSLFQRAASVNPLSPDWNDMAVLGLILVGDTKQADLELAHFSQLWPTDHAGWNNQLNSFVAQRRWADALAHLDAASATQFQTGAYVERWRALVTAVSTHNPTALSALRQKYIALGATDPKAAFFYLAFLGYVDDAFAVAQKYQPVQPDGADSPDFLFEPRTAALRQDSRFMALANKFGLPQYWRATGKWPDFCAVPGLPYNCQQEAAKLKPVSGLFPAGG